MIILDTHIWVWWVHQDAQLPATYHAYLQAHAAQGLGVSGFSCWEVAKLSVLGRLVLPKPIGDWLKFALNESDIQLLALTPSIAVEANQLPGNFHRDPADQIIVATARVYGCLLITLDGKIRQYPHVQLVP